MLIIGGKQNNLDLNKFIDSFQDITRINFAIPNGKNGTGTDLMYVNNHIYENFIENKKTLDELKVIYHKTHSNHIEEVFRLITKYNVKEMMEVSNVKSNKILKKHNLSKLTKNGRCGFQTILEYLKEDKEIFIIGFSIDDLDTKTYYMKGGFDDNINHKIDEEHQLVLEMHNKKLIDASLCILEDNEENELILNCLKLKPTLYMIEKLLNFFNHIKLKNYIWDDLNHLRIKKHDNYIIVFK